MRGDPGEPHSDAQCETAPEDFEREHEMRRPTGASQTTHDVAGVEFLRLPIALQAADEIVSHGAAAP